MHLGAVWEVSPPVTMNGAWTGRNIHEFCLRKSAAVATMEKIRRGCAAIDGKGDLFGTRPLTEDRTPETARSGLSYRP